MFRKLCRKTGQFAVLAILASCAQPALQQAAPPAPSLQPASFADLPGWQQDNLAELLPALRLQCQRLALLPADTALGGAGLAAPYGGKAGQWTDACTAARDQGAAEDPHSLFQTWFQPYLAADNALVTGFFEPLVPGALQQGGPYQTPVLARPSDLTQGPGQDAGGRPTLGRMVNGTLAPYYTRAEIEAGGADATTHPIAWVKDPIDLFFAQIQGSMRLQLPEGGTTRLLFDGRNGRPYTPIGRILKQQNQIAADDISLQTIRTWLQTHPGDAKTIMDRNESYVFFRIAPDQDPTIGPEGALGVALTAGRSAAVDKRFLPLAAPLYLDTTIPDGRAWQHLVLAQDLGSAIEGPKRVDLYLGSGPPAAAWAGHMHQPAKLWLLLPRTAGR